MRQIIRRTHTGKKMEDGYFQSESKYWQTIHSQEIIDSQGTKEGTFTCHIGSGYDVILMIVYPKIIRYGFLSKERMV